MNIPGLITNALRFGVGVIAPSASGNPFGVTNADDEAKFQRMAALQERLMEVQYRMQELGQNFSTQSNISKTEHETAMNIIRSVK